MKFSFSEVESQSKLYLLPFVDKDRNLLFVKNFELDLAILLPEYSKHIHTEELANRNSCQLLNVCPIGTSVYDFM